MRDGHHHVFARDQIFVVEIAGELIDLGHARRRVLFLDLVEFVANDAQNPLARAQDIEIILDLLAKRVEFVADFVPAKRRQPRQGQRQNGPRLLVGKLEGAILVDLVARIVDQPDQIHNVRGRPIAFQQLLARGRGVRR